MSKRKATSKNFTLETKRGATAVQAVMLPDGSSQLNCHFPPGGGPGLFAQYAAGTPKHVAADGMRRMIEAGPHGEDEDLSALVPAAIVAGSATAAQVAVPRDAVFGIPKVVHAG